MQVESLKKKIQDNGYTFEKFSAKMRLSLADFYRKLQKQSFSLIEVERIKHLLQLTTEESASIFLV